MQGLNEQQFCLNAALVARLRQKYVVFEGADGSGKSTLQSLFKGFDHIIELVNEPGSLPVSTKLREILLDGDYNLNALTELLLFMASRSELVDKKIAMVINHEKRGVISDRCYWSTYAYQHVHQSDFRTIFDEIVKCVYLNKPAIDLIIYCDVKPEVGLQRAAQRAKLDNFEQRGLSYFQSVAQGYRNLVESFLRDAHFLVWHDSHNSNSSLQVDPATWSQKVSAVDEGNDLSQSPLYQQYILTYNYRCLFAYNQSRNQYLLMLNTNYPLDQVVQALMHGLTTYCTSFDK